MNLIDVLIKKTLSNSLAEYYVNKYFSCDTLEAIYTALHYPKGIFKCNESYFSIWIYSNRVIRISLVKRNSVTRCTGLMIKYSNEFDA